MNAPKQADIETKAELAGIVSDKEDTITLHDGRKVTIGWLRPDVQDKIDDIITSYEKKKKDLGMTDKDKQLSEGELANGNKVTRQFYAQAVAAILLNGHYFRLKWFWGIKWRLLYHFGKMDMEDYLLIITCAKKKAQPQESYLAMASLMDMTTMWTMMTKKEAEAYRQELELVREHQSLKSSQT